MAEYSPPGPSLPKIGIASNGDIAFSSKFCVANGIYSYNFVNLYVDESRRSVAFRFTREREGDGALRLFELQKRRLIRGRWFFAVYTIDPKRHVGKYVPAIFQADELGIDRPGKVYVIELQRALEP